MKTQVLFSIVFVFFLFTISCEKDTLQPTPEIDDEVLALVQDEILADISFAELLDEGDDGIFWGDTGFSALKSAEIVTNECRSRSVVEEDDKKIVTLDFSNELEGCIKSGTIIIEYHKPNDLHRRGKKLIRYIDFSRNKRDTINGVKTIVRGLENRNIKAEVTITRRNINDELVTISRNYERQVKWICGLGNGDISDNIKKVTGKTEVTKTVNGGEVRSYSRNILHPLLIVKACELRIQAGTARIEKANGTVVKINYGEMPESVECGYKNCHDSFMATVGDKNFIVTIETDDNGNRNRVRVEQTEG